MVNFIKKKSIIILIVTTLLLSFYWFQYRPYKIRLGCAKILRDGNGSSLSADGYSKWFKNCINSRGIER